MMTTDTADTTNQILEEILAGVHPLMAEALCLAAVPQWYNAALLGVMRQRDDGREAGLIERLDRYSFITPVSDGAYTVYPDERDFLQRHWIAQAPAAYRRAHQHALTYWDDHPDPNRFAQAQNHLYHLLFADTDAGVDYLIDRFRAYRRDRHLSAMERLVDAGHEAQRYLALLGEGSLRRLDHVLAHLEALLAQMRGQWGHSRTLLADLRQKSDLTPRLRPYVARAMGQALAHEGLFVEAVDEYQAALALFRERETAVADPAAQARLKLEQGHTRIFLGDAYVGLAQSARSPHDHTAVSFLEDSWLTHFFYFFISLPLLLYLSLHLGRRVWHPQFWPALHHLDWMIARLFALGGRQYILADDLLETHGDPADGVAADERQARLYLAIGDMAQAEQVSRRLLTATDAPLGEYRRAQVQVGLGEALLRQGEAAAARQELATAVPTLEFYEDDESVADAVTLLAEAVRATDPDQAVVHYRQALDLYRRLDDVDGATNVAERLQSISDGGDLNAEQATAVADTLNRVTQRRYRTQYRHPVTLFSQRLTLVLLALLIFLIPVAVLRLDTGSAVVPEITFNASPLMEADEPDFTPTLSQGVSSLSLVLSPDSKVLIWMAAALFLLYLMASNGIALLVMLRTPLRAVQEAGEADAVTLDETGVHGGGGDGRRTIPWEGIRRLQRADVSLWRHRMEGNSTAVLQGEKERIRIKGVTNWYPALLRRLEARLPAGAERIDLSYTILGSKLGVLYVVAILLSAALILLTAVLTRTTLVNPPPLLFAAANYFPFFYLGLSLPIVWWLVVRPLRIQMQLNPASRLPLWVGMVGLLIGVLRIAALFRPWLTVPDIHVTLVILFLVGMGASALWRGRWFNGEPAHSLAVRLPALAAATAVLLIFGGLLLRQVAAYAYLSWGNIQRNAAFQSESASPGLWRTAVDAYGRAVQIAEIPILGISGPDALNVPVGIPEPRHFTWFAALNSRAAIEAQLGQYDSAIQDYNQLLQYKQDDPTLYVSRAIALMSVGMLSEEERGVGERPYAAAIRDFNRALALDPDNAYYHLWRGVAYHALGEETNARLGYETALDIEGETALDAAARSQALIGLGWLDYGDGDYRDAEALFNLAVEADPTAADAYVGKGYANYSLREYDAALDAWNTAAALKEKDPDIFTSLGTLYWRLGMVGDDFEARGDDLCSADYLSEAEKERVAERLETSIVYFDQAIEIPDQEAEDLASVYLTKAQVQYLLRNCPGFDSSEMEQRSLESYDRALELDPDIAP